MLIESVCDSKPDQIIESYHKKWYKVRMYRIKKWKKCSDCGDEFTYVKEHITKCEQCRLNGKLRARKKSK